MERLIKAQRDIEIIGSGGILPTQQTVKWIKISGKDVSVSDHNINPYPKNNINNNFWERQAIKAFDSSFVRVGNPDEFFAWANRNDYVFHPKDEKNPEKEIYTAPSGLTFTTKTAVESSNFLSCNNTECNTQCSECPHIVWKTVAIITLPKEQEEKQEAPITEKEKAHYWYHLGAAEGIVASIGGKKPEFEKAWSKSPTPSEKPVESHEEEPCPNCKETQSECACMRNICIRCGNPVGNITFTLCDDCWDIDLRKNKPAGKPDFEKMAEESYNKHVSICSRAKDLIIDHCKVCLEKIWKDYVEPLQAQLKDEKSIHLTLVQTIKEKEDQKIKELEASTESLSKITWHGN